MTIGFHAALSQGTAGDRIGSIERIRPLLGRELAGEDQVDMRYLSVAGPSGIDEVEHPSEVVQTRSRWDQGIGEIYDEQLDKDIALDAVYTKLFDEVLGRERLIDPGDATPDAVESARLSQWALSKIGGLDIAYRHWLGADPRGLATVEGIYDRIDRGQWRGATVPVDLIDRPMKRIAFDRKRNELYIRRPEGKFIRSPYGKMITRQRGTKDNPWGKAQCDKTYWLSEFTLHGWVFWNLFIERRADPIPYVGYPSKPDEKWNLEQQQLARQVVEALRDGKGAYGPDTLAPKFIESALSASVSYEKFIAGLNQLKAIFVLGDMQIADMDSRSGAYNSKSVAADRFLARVALIGHDFAAFVTDHVLLPIHLMNFGPHVAAPKMRLDLGEGEQREIRREGLKLAEQYLLDVPESWVYRVVGAPRTREGEQPFDWNAKTEPEPTPDASDEGPDTPETDPAPDDPTEAPKADEDDDQTPKAGSKDLAAPAPSIELAEDIDTRQASARVRAQEDVAAAFRGPYIDHFARQQKAIADAWDRGDFEESSEPLAEILTGEAARELGETVLAAVAHGAGLAMSDLIADGLPSRLWQITVPDDRPADLPLHDNAPALALSEAGDAARAAGSWQGAVEWWSDRLAISRDAFLGLEADFRRMAFSVAGVDDLRLLTDVHRLIGEALAEGLDRTAFRERLAELYRRRGLDPTSDWHADLVLNNNVRQAHAWIRWAQTVDNPAAHTAIPYLRFVTLDDEKVRARAQHHHRVMHGRVFATSHPIWHTWWYPAGHGCRCAVELITRAEAQRLGLTGSEPTGPWPVDPVDASRRAHPDPGFDGIGRPTLPAIQAAETLTDMLRQMAPEGVRPTINPGPNEPSSPAGHPGLLLLAIARALLLGLLGTTLLRIMGLLGDEDP